MNRNNQPSPVAVWDFTLSEEKWDGSYVDLAVKIDKMAKKWTFQLEQGETGYKHFQGRISLKTKARLNGVRMILPNAHWSKTSNANKNNMFYVMKDDTRVSGPWDDSQDIIPGYIPRQIRQIQQLRPWQQQVLDNCKVWDDRTINILFDPEGCTGKSIIRTWIGVHKLGIVLPYCNDIKDIMRMVMNRPKRGVYICDMPRSLNKDKLYGFFGGIESIKDGHAYDDRYKYKEEFFDSPVIWVFTNKLPEEKMLSKDRWVYWRVNGENKLEQFDRMPELNEAHMAVVEEIGDNGQVYDSEDEPILQRNNAWDEDDFFAEGW